MKSPKHIYTLFIIICALITSCTSNEERNFEIQGVWVLTNIHIPDGSDFNYYERSNTMPMKIFTDSIYYVAMESSEPERFCFRPSYSGTYRLINKGNNECLYVEDGSTHELTIENDTVINIKDLGRSYEWHKMQNEANINDVLKTIEQDKDSWNDNQNYYVFSETERHLQSDKNNLITIILCIILGFALLAYYTRNLYQNKARIEAQLKQIRKEIDERPKVVQDALKSVENDFLNSDFYLSIRKRISNGERMKKADWDEIERHVNSTYSGFTSRLFNLYPMSQIEMQTSLLIKLRVPATEIANTLTKSTSTISSIRSRLYGKVFNSKGSAKDWDEFILSL